MNYAPVVLFVYKRLHHVMMTVDSLKKNLYAENTDLIIYSDGPREENEAEAVSSVRRFLKKISGFKSIEIKERESNWGLSRSIITGVSEVVDMHRRIIVLEDDMVTSQYFLKFMNEALETYENDDDVISAHGYIFPLGKELPETFFLKDPGCWGWATWKRGWDLFEPDGQKLLEGLRKNKLLKKFDYNKSYPYSQMLIDQINGKNDSWAVRWYASALLKDRLTLYPGRSLVHNTGNDSTGVHSGSTSCYDTFVSNEPVSVIKKRVTEDLFIRSQIQKYFSNTIIKHNISKFRININNISKLFRSMFKTKKILKKKDLKAYESFEEARLYSKGYDSCEALEKTKRSMLKVKEGRAIYERDSVLFDKVQYSWPLLACIMWIASQNNNSLNLIDFGGALGTTYYQNRKFLNTLEKLQWNVIEQENYVSCGKKFFETEFLKFYNNIADCISDNNPNLIILSGVLQYLTDPYSFLQDLFNKDLEFIIIDRTSFSSLPESYVGIQKVNPVIYDASYPIWFFNYEEFTTFFSNKYILIEEFDSFDKLEYPSFFKGFIFKKKIKEKL